MNKVAIIQARMSSSRLPGKVLSDIGGKPMLLHVIERARQARLVDQVVLATTSDPSDDILARFCQTNALPCFRGSLTDVLDRFYQAASQFHADVIIRMTGDCPLLDPDLIDRTIQSFLGNPGATDSSPRSLLTDHSSPITGFPDFSANRLPPPWQRTLPIGLDVEVCSFDALQRAWKEADQLYQREHVMPYLYDGVVFAQQDRQERDEWFIQQGRSPHGFIVTLLSHFPDFGALRWTVDTPADLEFVRQVYAHLGRQADFDWRQVLKILETEPELALINVDVQHKSAYDVDKRSQAS